MVSCRPPIYLVPAPRRLLRPGRPWLPPPGPRPPPSDPGPLSGPHAVVIKVRRESQSDFLERESHGDQTKARTPKRESHSENTKARIPGDSLVTTFPYHWWSSMCRMKIACSCFATGRHHIAPNLPTRRQPRASGMVSVVLVTKC